VRYKVSKRYGCTVALPPDVLKALGWKLGTHLKLAVGGGELFGKLKLTEDPAGLPVVQKGKADAHYVKLGRWAQLSEREVDRIAVEHQVDGQALIITLPSHALNVTPAAAVPSVPARSPFGGKVDVIEKVVGRNGMQSGTRSAGR
jgi:hypothetical protein